jgi:uncharacterized iron-regulated membrane protein
MTTALRALRWIVGLIGLIDGITLRQSLRFMADAGEVHAGSWGSMWAIVTVKAVILAALVAAFEGLRRWINRRQPGLLPSFSQL